MKDYTYFLAYIGKHHQSIENAWIIQTSHALSEDGIITGQIYYIMAK